MPSAEGAIAEAVTDAPSAPICAFCWPALAIGSAVEPQTGLARCARCAAAGRCRPRIPSFLWRDLRNDARAAFAVTQDSSP